MNRSKKLWWWLLGVPAVLLLLLLVAGWLLGPRIKELAVGQINNYLSVPVKVGDISFSLIRKFPYASVDFSEVSTKGAPVKGTREELLNARHIFLQFSWWDLLKDDLRLKKITIEDATCTLFEDAEGKENFDVFKKGSGSSSFNLELEEIILNETTVNYRSVPGKRDYVLHAKEMTWHGIFSAEVYDLSGEGDLFVERLKSEEVNYISAKETKLKLNMRIDSKAGTYDIRESSLRIAALDLSVDGNLREKETETAVNLKIQSKDAGLKELLSLIPGVYTEKLQEYEYDGSIYFNLQLSGAFSKSKQPLVKLEFGSANASLRPKGSDYTLSNIRFTGMYTNRVQSQGARERLELRQVEARLQGQPLKMDLVMEDFKDPWINLSAKSKVDLQVLSRFYMPDTLESMSGSLLVDARIKGRAKDSGTLISEGVVEAAHVSFKLKNSPVVYEDFNGRVSLQGNRLSLTQLSGKAAGSDFNLNGSFDNVYAYVLTKDEVLSGQVQLVSRNLDLNELLEDKSASAADSSYRLDFNERLRVSVGVNIGILSFRKFQAWQVNGKLSVQEKVLSGTDLRFKAFDGHLLLNGRMDASRGDSVLIACDADLKNLDVTEMFTQLGNFGQEVIRDKNVKGKLTATVQFASTWSKDLHCNLNKVYAKSKLRIDKGELIDFEPMLALSRYLKSADLKQIKFETLQNEIEISHQSISIPTMEIKSSVMDLVMSGTHSFDNVVDYKMQLYLSQILGKKVKDRNTEFGTVEDDGLGRMRIFLTMKGPMADPKIVYDRKGIEQKITTDIKKEKQDLKSILHQEFGWFKKDSTVTKKTDNQPKKQEELELELDPE